VRVSPILVVFFAGNAFAASDGRGNNPSRLDFANTAALRSMLEREEPLPSPATGHVAENGMEAESTALSASGKVRIAMWTSSPNLREAEVLVAVPPSTPSNAELVLEEIVLEAAPSEAITARTVRYASIDDNPHRQASRHKRRQPRSTTPNRSADDEQAKPSLLQMIFSGD
jgi:hypothetical protein